MPTQQSYKNHTRWDPIFHFFMVPVLLLNIAATGVWYGHHRYLHTHSGPWAVLMAVILFLIALKARMYAVTVQDRVIRLEERLRLASMVPAAELAELDSLTVKQYVALRFASNPELPALARRAIRENLTPKQIKESVVAWRPDTHRV
jgi:hypothetical protein